MGLSLIKENTFSKLIHVLQISEKVKIFLVSILIKFKNTFDGMIEHVNNTVMFQRTAISKIRTEFLREW